MKREGEMNKPHLNQNLIKLLLKSLIHFYGVRLNTMDPMMLIKFKIKILIQDQPKYIYKNKFIFKTKEKGF